MGPYKGTVLILFVFMLGVLTGCRSVSTPRSLKAKTLEPDTLYVYFGVDTMALMNSGTKDPDTGKSLGAPNSFTVKLELDDSIHRERVSDQYLAYRPEYFYSKDDKQWIVQPMNLLKESIPLEPGSHCLRVIVEGEYMPGGLSDLFSSKRIPLKFYSDPIEFESTPGEAVVLRGVFGSSSIELNTGLGKGHVVSDKHNTSWLPLSYDLDGEVDLPEKDKLMTATERAKWFLIKEGIVILVGVISPGGSNALQGTTGNKDFQMHTFEMRFYQVDDGLLHLDPEHIIFPDQIANLRLPPQYWMAVE